MVFPPAPAPSLLQPLRVAFPGLRVLSPQGLSSGHIAFPAPTPPRRLSRLPRPLPAWPFLRPHCLPCSDPSGVVFFTGLRVLSPQGLSSGHIAFPAPTLGVVFFSVPALSGPGHYLLRLLLFQFSFRPLPCPLLVCASSCFRKEAGLSPGGAVLSASGSKKCRFVRPKEGKIFGETAAKSYLVERNPSNP